MAENASISVIIPCKNEGDLLREAVDSVLKQQVDARFEVVVIDDHSDDSVTKTILAQLNAQPNVQVFTNHRAAGPAGARNAGVQRAQGEWIAFLDADDLLTADSLKHRWEAAKNKPGALFIAGNFTMQSLDGSVESWLDRFEDIPEVSTDIKRLKRAQDGTEGVWVSDPASILVHGIVRIYTVFVKKTFFDQAGGFNELLWVGEDFHLCMRLGNLAKSLYFIPQPLAIYRRRQGSITVNRKHPAERGREATLLLLRDPGFRRLHPLLRKRLNRMDSALMWHYRTEGSQVKALLASLRLLWRSPLEVTSWRNVVGTMLRR